MCHIQPIRFTIKKQMIINYSIIKQVIIKNWKWQRKHQETHLKQVNPELNLQASQKLQRQKHLKLKQQKLPKLRLQPQLQLKLQKLIHQLPNQLHHLLLNQQLQLKIKNKKQKKHQNQKLKINPKENKLKKENHQKLKLLLKNDYVAGFFIQYFSFYWKQFYYILQLYKKGPQIYLIRSFGQSQINHLVQIEVNQKNKQQ